MCAILITQALPYANGPLHLGHILESIQTDIWVRIHKMLGHECYYVCGDDAHGTPIMLSARFSNITPEELIARIKQSHEQDLAGFFIEFDNFYTTHSAENKELVEYIYRKLVANGDIEKRVISQAYDNEKQMFLPDRFVRGTCPKCSAPDQHGDSCEVCGATYSPIELHDPVSILSGMAPVQKETEHYFFKLDKYGEFLRNWLTSGHVQQQVVHKLNEWFQEGLKQWDIARDEPYFGFKIPGTKDKYFYVWLDAPIGYMASFKHLCKRIKIDFDEFWGQNSKAELYHFIGKDLVYFHALFWPAVLYGAGFRQPTEIFTHGFLTVNGQKMSKSRGTFIEAKRYLEILNPECLRFYLAAKLNSGIDDIDLNLEDFMLRVNSDIVGKVVNIASRCANFITKNFAGQLADHLDDAKLFEHFKDAGDNIADLYIRREYNLAIREIMVLADKANQYIDAKKPWVLARENKDEDVQRICSMGLNLFRMLMIYLKPVLPHMAHLVEQFLNIETLMWNDKSNPLLKHKINQFKPLMTRIEKESLKLLCE